MFDNHDKVKNDTVIHVWKGPWPKTVSEVTKRDLRVVLSTPWYLNYISYGSDWPKYYKEDPHNFAGSESQKRLVIGGEVSAN